MQSFIYWYISFNISNRWDFQCRHWVLLCLGGGSNFFFGHWVCEPTHPLENSIFLPVKNENVNFNSRSREPKSPSRSPLQPTHPIDQDSEREGKFCLFPLWSIIIVLPGILHLFQLQCWNIFLQNQKVKAPRDSVKWYHFVHNRVIAQLSQKNPVSTAFFASSVKESINFLFFFLVTTITTISAFVITVVGNERVHPERSK